MGISTAVGTGHTVIVGAVRYAELCSAGRQLLLDNGFTLVENETTVPWTAEDLAPLLPTASAAICGVEVYGPEQFDAAPRLKIISRLGVGLDNIDLAEARRHGVDVVNAPGGNAIAVAELALGLLISLYRKIPAMNDDIRSGNWDRYVGSEVTGKRFGLIGFGAIARVFARRLAGFDAEILAYDPYADPELAAELGVKLVGLEEAVRDVDVVSVHAPHVPSTHHIVNTELIATMRPGTVLLNTSRGGLVDESALVSALESGHLAGAGLDVFETEPVNPSNPLLAFPTVVATTHAAADSLEAYHRIGLSTAQAIVDVFSGQRPKALAN
ncbi:D-3-phosphoglycerate dehydrogenase [Microbacteriaceae bacterium SG_E_30_P1]|uniref:D-3-phosphoglycerate dehydrogenase n=1 Tax=Antiquaquibacter oligotrophicus TaxID=2880260 RepID=A0ABT6KQ31_9MICO|nr:phosphoglycerate dehydrogenase [Antiquaquibacter oligotrophicus]MDH6182091.1 D-3-phosphoglycerate dehydrogenase [Antiquaquibacter oligotrophicus]UDF12244.1 phosphoglycerate dehydrogenase [Antiquaquibacter oligotrophicus]